MRIVFSLTIYFSVIGKQVDQTNHWEYTMYCSVSISPWIPLLVIIVCGNDPTLICAINKVTQLFQKFSISWEEEWFDRTGSYMIRYDVSSDTSSSLDITTTSLHGTSSMFCSVFIFVFHLFQQHWILKNSDKLLKRKKLLLNVLSSSYFDISLVFPQCDRTFYDKTISHFQFQIVILNHSIFVPFVIIFIQMSALVDKKIDGFHTINVYDRSFNTFSFTVPRRYTNLQFINAGTQGTVMWVFMRRAHTLCIMY